MTTQTFTGATVYLPGEIAETSVTVSEGRIAEIGGPTQGDTIDGRGLILAPALIDVHGDAFERQVMPRPGVFFPIETAVLETDRQLAANGIATTYHSITLSYEPGLRSVERARVMMQAIQDLAPRLTVENRIQLRWETFAFEALDLLDWAMDAPLKPSLAFNDHLSMAMRSADTVMQDRLFEHNPGFAAMDLADAALFEKRYRKHTERSGLDYDDHKALVHKVWDRRPEVLETLKRVAGKARQRGIPMLSHDDTQAETRRFYHEIGATTSEFPMTMGPVEQARKAGDMIIFGSPNAVRGGSHIGSLGAADMVEAGLCDALASDYYYPAMLAAVDRLDRERRADRLALWSQVSSGPAKAMRLTDRGDIAVGKRADLVLVDWPDGHAPAVRATYSAGRCAYAALPSAA
ncbi:Metal-dependent hydrolase involved in phosphonate metabolism [Candidatus Rhodobacter oscarellae]|uniref:Metal-dependent hydrolase involved in phosphonate metabolism n=1 Tax=Candidatus Rhodobacter oscarellae TaxID=1675527 RepID=A0A0J9E7H9_9RHOB|nr:alpha-D-ribose 1-methylphosphonate 5-triphosphate diphosphatase [Candidatus Rhodobacter lobularis]KMW57744.1 Metal-dependent hydrolase involved in phosphonate metabolism [Candidatus Rhodobacter lobularis]